MLFSSPIGDVYGLQHSHGLHVNLLLVPPHHLPVIRQPRVVLLAPLWGDVVGAAITVVAQLAPNRFS